MKDNVISILPISELKLFNNKKNFNNEMYVKGKIFTIPFTYSWVKYFSNTYGEDSVLKIKKLNLRIKNLLVNNDRHTFTNIINLNRLELITDFILKENTIEMKSKNLKKSNNNINYRGKINKDPFDLKLDVNLKKINLKKIFSYLIIFENFLNLETIYNKNLNAKISLSSNKIINNKLFDSLSFLINFENGKINLNKSNLKNNKIGNLLIQESNFYKINDELFFTGNFNYLIKDELEFFKSFQIKKKNRKALNNINFNIKYNFFKKKMTIYDFNIGQIGKLNTLINDQFIEDLNAKLNNKNINWIDLKNFINEIIKNYSG